MARINLAEESPQRRRRRTFIGPLENMTVAQIIMLIDDMGHVPARALLRAMDSCGTTNCSWVTYQIAQRFRKDVLLRLEYIQRTKV